MLMPLNDFGNLRLESTAAMIVIKTMNTARDSAFRRLMAEALVILVLSNTLLNKKQNAPPNNMENKNKSNHRNVHI